MQGFYARDVSEWVRIGWSGGGGGSRHPLKGFVAAMGTNGGELT
jgi:hypothetical protein